MLISKYIHEKQKLLEAQGVKTILVPESQIDDSVEQLPLHINSNGGMCPYCVVFGINVNWEAASYCVGCPMYEVGNGCHNFDSTYQKAHVELGGNMRDVFGLKELVDKYNEELENVNK